MNDVREDIELVLEDLFNDELSCQYKHGRSICSVHVVSRVRASCSGDTCLRCQVSTDMALERMASRKLHCKQCGDLTADCWEVIYI